MIQRILGLVLPAILVVPAAVGAATPIPQEIVDRMIEAVGGEAAFSGLGVLELVVSEEETRNDGTSSKSEYTLYVDSSDLSNLRKEFPGNVIIGRSGADGWATNDGVLDDRRQTPYMARGTLNQAAFPLLLPFSLRMEGVWVKEVGEIEWDGRDAWVLSLPFAKGFFTSAIMTTTWAVVVAKDDYSILAVNFVPSPEYRKVQKEGIRYRILKTTDLNGVQIPAQLLLVGVNPQGQESGHVRVTKIRASVRGPWEPTLFMNPRKLEELEEE